MYAKRHHLQSDSSSTANIIWKFTGSMKNHAHICLNCVRGINIRKTAQFTLRFINASMLEEVMHMYKYKAYMHRRPKYRQHMPEFRQMHSDRAGIPAPCECRYAVPVFGAGIPAKSRIPAPKSRMPEFRDQICSRYS